MVTSEEVQKAFHYLYPAELPVLKELVRSLPDSPLVINIGAGAGTSGLAILESRPDVTLITVDIQDASSPFGCLEAERSVVREAGLRDLWEKRWFQIHTDSKYVGANWPQALYSNGDRPFMTLGKVSMVFVDGDHSYEGCKGDIEVWVPHIIPGGILAVHDYLKGDLQPDPNGPHPKPWPGVDSAVNELLLPNFEMIVHVASLVAFRIPA